MTTPTPTPIRELYPMVERDMLPFIRRRAYRLRHYVDVDDAVQEGRMVLLRALQDYDINRCPSLERYVQKCLVNSFNAMYHHAIAQCRMPHAVTQDHNGAWRRRPVRAAAFEEGRHEPPGQTRSPEAALSEAERRHELDGLLEAIRDQLTDRDLETFQCMLQEDEDQSNVELAERMGITKNAVDWSLFKIRRLFLRMARSGRFSEALRDEVCQPGWPMFHVSEGTDDDGFIDHVMSERELDADIVEMESAVCGRGSRTMAHYSWGLVMWLTIDDRHFQIVAEGRFNALFGILYGDKQGHDTIPVVGYLSLVKALKDAEA